MRKQQNPGMTHAEGCFSWGSDHYECALRLLLEIANSIVTLEDKHNKYVEIHLSRDLWHELIMWRDSR